MRTNGAYLHGSRCQTASLLRSRGAFSSPGFCILASLTRIEGERSAEGRSGARRNTRWACRHASKTRVNALMTRHARRLRGALRPMTRDARLSALHRGDFGLQGRASLTGRPPPDWLDGLAHHHTAMAGSGSVTASSSHPGRSAWRAGSRTSRGKRLRAAAAGRHASLRLQDRLRRRPSMSEAANLLALTQIVANN